MKIDHIKEGKRIFKRAKRVRKQGLYKYEGDADKICFQIIEDCWNGVYFMTSSYNGHFCEFYMRDFAWAVKALMQLGYEKKVKKTLEYALDKYSKDKLTTTINPEGKCVDIFDYSPDSIAYLIHSLKIANADELITKYKDFLQMEIKKCFDKCFDTNTSLMKKDAHFGSIKDSTFRYCSTYDNTMLAMMSKDLDILKLENPFQAYDIKKAMIENLWNKEKGYWYDDLSKYDIVTGDSNTFPYWTGVFTDKKMIESSIKNIIKAGLDNPFPLKYSNQKFGKESLWRKLTVPEYQTHSIKTHMGCLYIHVVNSVDKEKAKEYKEKYKKLIEKYGTYLENFFQNGEPLNTKFYFSDEANVWSANFLTL
ncbi:MAG: hypothetical protein ACOCWI_02910 [Bacillota bacterium]